MLVFAILNKLLNFKGLPYLGIYSLLKLFSLLFHNIFESHLQLSNELVVGNHPGIVKDIAEENNRK